MRRMALFLSLIIETQAVAVPGAFGRKTMSIAIAGVQ